MLLSALNCPRIIGLNPDLLGRGRGSFFGHSASQQRHAAYGTTLGQYRGPVVGVLSFKIGKIFHLGEKRQLEGNFQIFNVLNTSAAVSTTYLTGSRFGDASSVVSPRVARVGAYFSF